MSKLCITYLLITLALSFSLVANSQDSIQKSIVKADSTWRTEIIPFPVDWLPKLTIKGFEELRFAPNWKNPEHQEFWTLAMAWQVETTEELSLKEIHFNLNHYFTALMHPNHWAQEFPDPKLILEDIEHSNNSVQFIGQMTFFDGFHTGKVITVNILGNQILCKTTNTSMILFKLSPKHFDTPIWDTLNKIRIDTMECFN
ncbi:hypothetical protein HNV08_08210 [Winogradskyella eckloniae]|uniref:hypothetical protein n=1 Tax=Winogradskyella eckloniae TaxID=1089306 RepID=UPI00156588E9|nr:hypothetical protein [Winogradskyella eckloniae]NRD20029.1 hypothetical protein [Winogradskyella eckloniae]